MIKYLYSLILLVCFYDALLLLSIPSSATFFLAEDGAAGYMISTIVAMIIGLWSISTFGFKPVTNLWLVILIGFIVFSSLHGPNISYESGAFIPKDSGLFNFKPMFQVLSYFLMFLGISSALITPEEDSKIGTTIGLIGIFYSGYIVLQYCGMDQVYKLVNVDICHLSRNPTCGGFISQPVFAAALLVICLPFVLRYFSIWLLLLIVIAIFLTGNRSAIIAGSISGVYLLLNSKKACFWAIMVYLAGLVAVMAIYWHNPSFNFHICDSERLITWKKVIQDIIHPAFPGVHKAYVVTGFGIGSFSVIFPFFNHSNFLQAHNEYLEVLYALSFVGLFLLIKAMIHLFKAINDRYIFASLIGISVFAITNPVWHVPQLQFLTVLLIGLAYNKDNIYDMGKVC